MISNYLINELGLCSRYKHCFSRYKRCFRMNKDPPSQYPYPPPQSDYPPPQGGYPPPQGGYPPPQGGYPAYGGYPPNQPGYPSQQGYYPDNSGAVAVTIDDNDDFVRRGDVGLSDPNIRRSFIRKVYLILTLQFGVTCATILILKYLLPKEKLTEDTKSKVFISTWICFAIFFIAGKPLISFHCYHDLFKNYIHKESFRSAQFYSN